ncbi:hypothetical protein F8A10_01715 [Paracoccus kondratievae]|uniref:hypothetical protein n=1 Tax=Paracoccus kondratievae TaxID=135740 RepID=UPI00126623E7|nr:hypothetical protein [Paracoccus kondratievae]QFQ86250.1 hypothetical protein F8A10_01715 [Paracoccus kondratievae]
MQISTTPEMWVVQRERRLRIPEIANAAAELAPEIGQQIKDAGLEVAGPWIFIAQNLPKDGETEFDWRICRPVAASGSAVAGLHHLPPVPVASALHEGPLAALFSDGYAPLLAKISAAGRALTGESREIYHDWTGPGAERQKIEIQFGLTQ